MELPTEYPQFRLWSWGNLFGYIENNGAIRVHRNRPSHETLRKMIEKRKRQFTVLTMDKESITFGLSDSQL